ncbi:MAG TPA: FAD/NAD(P)-binding protein [Myxococcales bacterium]|nr:FAD/NAD(P)-binding protein [Myxococcales bacterium]
MRADVVVIGGGAAGTLLTAQLLRSAWHPFVILLLERTGRIGEGLAYSTHEPMHLLNVPAGKMSAFPDEPGHFLSWLQVREPGAQACTFAPRLQYARYLRETLSEAEARSPATLVRMAGNVVDLRGQPGGVCLTLDDGLEVDAGAAVLAIGNAPSTPPDVPDDGVFASDLYRSSPWAPGALDGLAPDSSVLLIGSGLTTVDTIVALQRRRHRGVIHVISRHGLLPQRHAPGARPFAWKPEPPTSARSLLQQIREHSQDVGWRAVMDGLRPLTQKLWRGLPEAEKRRFLRHARTYWDIHRHRMAPEVAEIVDAMERSGQLRVRASRLLSVKNNGAFAAAQLRPRGSLQPIELQVGRIINCTGPATLHGARLPLIQRLLARGLGRLDSLGLGLEVDARFRCVDELGNASLPLFALGPLLRGELWETTAIPEISAQAQLTARAVGRLLEPAMHPQQVG